MSAPNDGSRSLEASSIVPELVAALNDWKKVIKQEFVLIGGLALSYHVKPRYTQDIDVMLMGEDHIPDDAQGFRRIRPHCFEHTKTGVEIEVLTATFLKIPLELIRKVVEDAVESGGIKVASRKGLIALKLSRYSLQDQADIELLFEGLFEKFSGLKHMADWPLSPTARHRLVESLKRYYTAG